VFWSSKTIKVDFEAAVISAINKVFPDSVITGRNFHFIQYLWRQTQNIGLTVEYKDNEQVRIIVRMCAALAYQPIDKVEGWLMIMESVPQNEK
jgi:long-subunit fatty acid transport protein